MKNTKLARTLCSLALVLALALCCLPAAFASENEISVDFSFYNGAVVIPKTEIKFYDGIAEEYGYEMSSTDHSGKAINSATVFDALVAAHKIYYGQAFTKETSKNYLEISYGFVTKAFGIKSSAWGMCINDKVSHDDVYVDAYGGYTGYSFDSAAINSDDYVSVYTYQDKSMYSDYYITLSDDKISTTTGEAFTISATGYSAMWYGCSKDEMISSQTHKMVGLDVYTTTDFKSYSKVGTLNENGEITLDFDNEGTVYLCIMGNFDDPYMGEVPVVANWCEVTVTEPDFDDGLYFLKDINVDFDANAYALNLTFAFGDINKVSPDITKNLTVDFSWLSAVIDLLRSIIK